jgi:Mn2+/Fe2+ NRAMP family transporter
MGGVGGSVTLLAYGYWIREKGWRGAEAATRVRIDLTVGYALTGLFGVAMLLLAAAVLTEGVPPGSQGLVACGDAIRSAAAERFGPAAARAVAAVFLLGVWGAVFTSTLGVWNGVPYLFADYLNALRGRYDDDVETSGVAYRGYLLYLAVPPVALLFLDRPMWVIKIYTLTGGLFMPVLAGTLLWLNSRRRLVGPLRNRGVATATLVLALLLFVLIAVRQIADLVV